MDAEELRYAAVYDLNIPGAEREVFKNFVKRQELATRITLIDIYDFTKKETFPNKHKLFTDPAHYATNFS